MFDKAEIRVGVRTVMGSERSGQPSPAIMHQESGYQVLSAEELLSLLPLCALSKHGLCVRCSILERRDTISSAAWWTFASAFPPTRPQPLKNYHIRDSDLPVLYKRVERRSGSALAQPPILRVVLSMLPNTPCSLRRPPGSRIQVN